MYNVMSWPRDLSYDLISHYPMTFYYVYIHLLPYSYQLSDIVNLILLLQNIVMIRNVPAYITSYYLIIILIITHQHSIIRSCPFYI